jgi:hypothetical protein
LEIAMAVKSVLLILACAGVFALPAAASAQSAQTRTVDGAVERNLSQSVERLQAQRKAVLARQAHAERTKAKARSVAAARAAAPK